METINLEKRQKIKKTLYSFGGLFFLGFILKDYSSFLPPQDIPESSEEILKDDRGRIIEIRNSEGIFKFNPTNPLQYEVQKNV